MNQQKSVIALALACLVSSVGADTLYEGALIYSMDARAPHPSGLCVGPNGRLIDLEACQPDETVNLVGKVVIPGLIEGHGHLMGYGQSLLNLNLATSKNLNELVDQVSAAVDRAAPGEWILGRGWHQSKWSPQPAMIKGFQSNDSLNAVSPDNPVFLVHASGHAAFVNDRALALAGITADTLVGGDGEIILDDKGQPTGVLNERAQRLVSKFIPTLSLAQRQRALQLALASLASLGITSFQDAGATQADINLYQEFLSAKQLTSRVYVMINGSDPELLASWMQRGPLIDVDQRMLTVRSIKLVADGALGSRGAWLLEPYSDRAGHNGLPTMPVSEMQDISHLAYRNGFQIAIHAIGDRANREVLDIFDALFDGRDRGVRFRVEHAQHIHPSDIGRFARLGVIPSVQGIHMSSDRPWAIDRLGAARVESGAYMWRSLIDSGAVLVNGTDVPVEPADPFASFYALVTRKTLQGTPEGGFEPQQKITRVEALQADTLNPAFGAFEESFKGRLAPGMVADFVVLDRDIMTIPAAEILQTKVLQTVMNGQVVYTRPDGLIADKER
jgi:predicted amidohydrolase YtcJ